MNIKKYEQYGGYGNYILYDMCKGEYNKHKEPEIIASKLWLIGRSYAASPERRLGRIKICFNDSFNTEEKRNKTSEIKKKLAEARSEFDNEENTSFFEYVAQKLSNPELMLDCAINNLTTPTYSFSDDKYESDKKILIDVVKIVIKLNSVIEECINNYNNKIFEKASFHFKEGKIERYAENNVSFVSKYLHFHLQNNIYIMDNISFDRCKQGVEIPGVISKKWDADDKKNIMKFRDEVTKEKPYEEYKKYASHVMRCYYIAKYLNNETDYACNPRAVDTMLMRKKVIKRT